MNVCSVIVRDGNLYRQFLGVVVDSKEYLKISHAQSSL